MALRTGHGTGAGVPRIEVLPPDEQPANVPGTPAPVERRRDGTVAGTEAARALGRLAAEKRAARNRFVAGLGIGELAADAAFRPFQVSGEDWVRAHLEELALQSGGRVGPGPASIVQSAGLQLAASRFLAEQGARTADAALLGRASSLANDSRQNLLAARELAVREAQARIEVADKRELPSWVVDAKGGDR